MTVSGFRTLIMGPVMVLAVLMGLRADSMASIRTNTGSRPLGRHVIEYSINRCYWIWNDARFYNMIFHVLNLRSVFFHSTLCPRQQLDSRWIVLSNLGSIPFFFT
mmetsp:Transcript_67232/g.179563  ORF Transcript_67232/g.179563 Transcript_67232/m.179563 type:complete len:105 (-) Transcript_67232:11-325(-)